MMPYIVPRVAAASLERTPAGGLSFAGADDYLIKHGSFHRVWERIRRDVD